MMAGIANTITKIKIMDIRFSFFLVIGLALFPSEITGVLEVTLVKGLTSI